MKRMEMSSTWLVGLCVGGACENDLAGDGLTLSEVTPGIGFENDDEDIDDVLTNLGIDPASCGEASEEEVRRIMEACFPHRAAERANMASSTAKAAPCGRSAESADTSPTRRGVASLPDRAAEQPDNGASGVGHGYVLTGLPWPAPLCEAHDLGWPFICDVARYGLFDPIDARGSAATRIGLQYDAVADDRRTDAASWKNPRRFWA